MDERPGEPIEIELTSNPVAPDPTFGKVGSRLPFGRRSGSALDAPADAGSGSTVATESWWTTERSRLASVALAAGAISLVLGLVVGRATGSTDDAMAGSATSEPSTTTTTTAPEPAGDGIVPLPRPRFPTTTTIEAPIEFTVSQVELDPRVSGQAITLVATGFDGSLSRLDLSTGRHRSRAASDRLRGGQGDVMLLDVGPDWALTWDYSGSAAVVNYDDGHEERSTFADPWSLFAGPQPGTFWSTDIGRDPSTPTVFSLVDLAGAELGPTFEIPAGLWDVRADPKGGLLAVVDGRNYSYMLDEADARTVARTYLGSGRVLGLSADLAVLRDCDADLECSVFVVDRSTGDERVVPLDQGLANRFSQNMNYGPASSRAQALSPDGRLLAVSIPTPSSNELSVIDLVSGSVLVDGIRANSEPEWSPDSSLLFVLDVTSRLQVVDVATGETFLVSPESTHWTDFAIRPSVPSIDTISDHPPSNDPRLEEPAPSTSSPTADTATAVTLP
ncbi:MAG: hypothetical protein ABIO83_03345 [Ilumatobacteraceae bacterium]